MGEKEEKARSYQRLLLERAIQENVILCLPTGSGKTLIAVNLIKHMLPDAIKENKKIVFLANKVHLINQQGKYIQSHCGVSRDDGANSVAIISGDLNTDFWKEDKWAEVLSKCHIMVITSEIFKQILNSAYITLKEVALIIFDECHHATKGDPMSKIIDSYSALFRDRNYPRSDLPRILGMTATIINTAGKVEKIQSDIAEVEAKFCGRVITHIRYMEVLGYSTSARVQIKTYLGYPQSPALDWDYRDLSDLSEMQDIIELIQGIKYKKLQDGTITHPSFVNPAQLFYSGKTLDKILKAVLQDVVDAFDELGPYCAKLTAKANIGYLDALLDPRSQIDDRNKIQAIEWVYNALEEFILKTELKFEAFSQGAQVQIFTSDKLNQLILILLQWRGTKTLDYDKCGLVFVKKRVTAQVLHWYFQCAKDYIGGKFELLATDFVVGSSGSRWGLDYDNMHFTGKKQTEALAKFRNKETNIIFTTSVLEEGLDVRNCDLGVRFDRIENYPSYVQSMGRVRHPNSPFYVLVESMKYNVEKAMLDRFEKYNKEITAFMVKKSILEDEDDAIDFNGIRPNVDIPGCEPFCPEGLPGSPTVAMDTSIQLVYRYCATLPCDQLAPLSPYSWWVKLPGSGGLRFRFKAYLQFPSNSVIKDVLVGPVTDQKKLSKQAVHLQACRLLYENDALDEHLLPITVKIPKAANEFIEKLRAEIREDGEFANGKVGTKKRTQWYPKAYPNITKCLSSPINKVLYLLRIRLTSSSMDTINNELYDFDRKPHAFGLLVNENTAVELDKIPEFPLFGKSTGDRHMAARLKRVATGLAITASQLAKLKIIQRQIFTKILRLDHPLLIDDEDSQIGASNMLVAPLIRNDGRYEVWWDIAARIERMDLKDFCEDPPKFQYSTTVNGTFTPDVYNDAVVVSCCMQRCETIGLQQLYVVKQVSPSLTSDSIMETKNGLPVTFLQHFQTKKSYADAGIRIKNPNFPLLGIKGIGGNLNFLSSKGQSLSKKEAKLRKDLYYPPDLVVIYPIPASLLIQATFLPSCLHRIGRLMLSSEIQSSVANMFNWKSAGGNNSIPIESPAIVEEPEREENPIPSTQSDLVANTSKLTLAENGVTPNPRRMKATIELEYIHPDKIPRGALVEAFQRKAKPSESALRNPVNFYKERFKLCELRSINFKSLDVIPDFETEFGPPIYTISEAFTLANAQDALSMESLEFIGDSVLKLFSSSHLYFHFPQANEGQMTALRGQLVSNANFYLRGKRAGLGGILAGGHFIPDKTWEYPGVQLLPSVASALIRNDATHLDCFTSFSTQELKEMSAVEMDQHLLKLISEIQLEVEAGSNESRVLPAAHTTYSHSRIGDKNIADSLEALVGAYFKHGGLSSASRVMAWLGLTAPTADGEILNYDLTRKPLKDTISPSQRQSGLAIMDRHMVYIDQLEERIGHRFKNRLLLLEAFSYPNFIKNSVTGCYQRLEFLGDAVLDFLIANHIYNEVQVKSPGQLTLLKSALVNNFTLACLTVKFGFHKYLLCASSKPFQDAIDAFVEFQELNDWRISGNGVPLKVKSLWESPEIAESLTVPKALGDIFESLIGAIYIDSGQSLDTTWRIIYRLMENEIVSFSKNIPRNIVMDLYEKYPDMTAFSVIDNKENTENAQRVLESTIVKLTIEGHGDFLACGKNKKEAKQTAAKWALTH